MIQFCLHSQLIIIRLYFCIGLGIAACLKKLGVGVSDVTVFEARNDFLQASLGGGLQLTGGAVVLQSLGASLFKTLNLIFFTFFVSFRSSAKIG